LRLALKTVPEIYSSELSLIKKAYHIIIIIIIRGYVVYLFAGVFLISTFDICINLSTKSAGAR